MATTVYTYSITTDFTSLAAPTPDLFTLDAEVLASGITSANYLGGEVSPAGRPDDVDLYFDGPISAGDKTTLDGVVAAHTGFPHPDPSGIGVWHSPIEHHSLLAPPVGAMVGHSYIVAGEGGTATGDWATHEKEIATLDASLVWQFEIPAEGTTAWLLDEDEHVVYDGTNWVPLQATRVRAYAFNGDFHVPSAGTLWLKNGGVPTVVAPLVINHISVIRGAALRVDVVDASRAYNLEILVNAAVEETLSLPTGFLKANVNNFTTPMAIGDELSVRLVRTSGSGKSTFANVSVSVEIEES